MDLRGPSLLFALSWIPACFYNPVIGITNTDPAAASTTSTVEPTTGDTGSSSTDDPGQCGDARPDPGEACDDGNAVDTDDCLSTCKLASCGDTAVHAGKELCDDGAQNSDEWSAVKHCAADCQAYAPHCGDGTCQIEQENANSCPEDGCEPICGNGVLEGTEACDDGDQDDTDACLGTCEAASCGDGLVRAGVEDCDDANSENTDACLNTCKAASCGDGFVQAGIEDCDDKNAINDDACSDDCERPRRIFVTSAAYKGNLAGLAGADLKCQALAEAAKLGGTYLAWLSDDTGSPSTRLDTSFTGAYKLIDGTVIASDGWPDLVDGMLAHAIDRDEKGGDASGELVWTNTTPAGMKAGVESCKAWSSLMVADNGRAGATDAVDPLWSDASAASCASSLRLYCVENP